MERNKRFFQGYLNLEPTDTALFINGLYYDLEVSANSRLVSLLCIAAGIVADGTSTGVGFQVSDLFVLLDSVKQETKLLEGLHDAGFDTETIQKMMKLDFNTK